MKSNKLYSRIFTWLAVTLSGVEALKKIIPSFLIFNSSFLICIFTSFLIPLLVFSQPTKTYIQTTGTGNPVSIDPGPFQLTQADNATASWTAVSFPAAGLANANKWSNNIALPFPFKFFGENVTNFKVTKNGILTFNTAVTTVPAGNNTNLPAISLPNKSIACLWDQYTAAPPVGANDIIYTRTLNLAPHRQFWIKWNSYEIGSPVKSDACFAIVFEETSNAIYIVDMYKGTPLATNLTATIGLQYDNRFLYSQSGATNLLSATTASSNNTWVKFTPTPITQTSLSYTNADLAACATSGTLRTFIPNPLPTCMETSLKSCKLYASLNLGEDYEFGGNNIFADSIGGDVAVNGYNAAGTLLFSGSAHLVINQTSVEKLYELDITGSYSGLSYISVGISGCIQSINVNVQNALTLKVWTATEYNVDVAVTPPTITLNVVNPDPTISPIRFSWTSSCPDVPQYEFQLMRLYNKGGKTYYSDPAKAKGVIDWENALSLIIENGADSIDLHLTEGTGYYAWRVRPIGNFYEGGAANNKNWGAWSASRQQGATYNFDGTENLGAGTFFYTQFDDTKNWIYNRVFTENNNIGENITYGDGVGRTKQTQHHLQSENNVLISQQLYDFSGRGALKTMAAPVVRNNFIYQEKFVTSDAAESELYRAKDFDDITTYRAPSAVLGGNLVEYYSDNNTDTRIPNAEGYPFSRSIYYADGTNRPKEISSPGAPFQIGNTSSGDDRTVKIYYSSISDPELIKIFGNEAPVDTSVYKMIQVDPNKVITVTYQTVDGKTIATCLADGGDIDLLDDLVNTPFDVVDVIENNMPSGENTSTKEKTVMINQPFITLWARYEITPAEIAAACGTYCSTCDYIVYGYIKENGNIIIWDTTITIPASACNSGHPYTFYHPISTNVASYTVGRSISIDNDVPASSNTYLENHQDAMASIMDDHIAANFDAMYDSLEANNIEGFYNYLVAQGYATANQIVDGNTITVTTECCSIEIPVTVCPPHPCEAGTPDFEAMLYSMWEHKYGNALRNYSKYNDVFNYPDNGTLERANIIISANTTNNNAFESTERWPNSYFIFKITYTGADGTTKTFNLGNDTVGFNQPLYSTSSADQIGDAITYSLADNMEAIYGDVVNFPYQFNNATFNNVLDFWPNLESLGDIGVMAGRVWLYSPNADFIVGGDITFDYIAAAAPNEDFPFGIGAFNELIGNMIEDGYPCDTLYNYWNTLCSSYELLQYDVNGTTDFNIVETFLESVGTMYGDAEPVEIYGDDAHPGILSHANKVIKYTAGACPDCESQIDTDGDGVSDSDFATLQASDNFDDIRTEPTEDKTWYKFYSCTQTCGGSLDDALSDIDTDGDGNSDITITECDGLDEFACAEQMKEEILEECEGLCEKRRGSFEDAIRDEYAAEGIIVTEAEIQCLADALVANCNSGCELTVVTHMEDITPKDGVNNPVEVLDRVGTDDEILAMQQSLTYTFDIRIPTDSTCEQMGYETIYSGGVDGYVELLDFEIFLADELNKYLDSLLALNIFGITTEEIRLEIDRIMAVNQIVLMEHFMQPYPHWEPCTSAVWFPDPGNHTPGPPIPMHFYVTPEDFEVDKSSGFRGTLNHVFLKFIPMFGPVIWKWSEQTVLINESCKAFWPECGPICFKWEYPDMDAEPVVVEMQTCEESAAEYLRGIIDGQTQACKEQYVTDITQTYESTCANPYNIDDVLTMGYKLGYFHYTLFYYDRGGNLVKTVPPKGVDEANNDRNDVPNHTYKTTYTYNSRKQMLSKKTPDGGRTQYYYNDLGQLRFSQNAQQVLDNKYSYLKYDKLGRIYESGQANICGTCPITSVAKLTEKVNMPNVPATGGEEKTFTVYTTPTTVVYTNAEGLTYSQEFLANRISYTCKDADGNITTANDQSLTYYSYDAHGNVRWLVKSIPGLGNKQIGFKYDLISGKITEVKYQEGQSDQYYYKYEYDADNRVTEVQTSRNGRIYDIDAKYKYYAHGPLERVVLGEDKVQGLDYLYTLQGWLKAVNHPQLGSGYDAGQDGVVGAANQEVPADAFGMVLNYYNGDFNRAGSVYNPSFVPGSGSILNKFNTSTHDTSDYKSYYNGFISSIISNNAATVTNNSGMPMVGMYLYDEIGRLTQSTIDFYSGSNMTGNWIGNTGNGSNYYEHFGYDVNGNIINVTRNGY